MYARAWPIDKRREIWTMDICNLDSLTSDSGEVLNVIAQQRLSTSFFAILTQESAHERLCTVNRLARLKRVSGKWQRFGGAKL